ncbi:hypothetical protein MLD38_025952 [Melastoma candidum]|uniref:Uncharacterized protein n=1 Tax=Melastoma candidum TaxID=119954 RepID=A0ACB9P0I8_9MYRT|nr:hypothetical protein MLD38_025952 [Melastoma candidum]
MSCHQSMNSGLFFGGLNWNPRTDSVGFFTEADVKDPSMRSLSRQGSLYGLTLDEVHSQIGNVGKPLGSMNLDELLKSVWSADVTNQGCDTAEGMENPRGQHVQGNQLQKQPSFMLSRALSQKTVDEVWKDIQQGKGKKDAGAPYDGQEGANRDRQPTLGEITLEDFLSLAGVEAEPPEANRAEPKTGVLLAAAAQQENNLQHGQWMNYQLASVQQQQNIVPLFMPANHVQQPISVVPTAAPAPFLDTGFSDALIALSPSSFLGAVSDTQSPGLKRVAPEGVIEKTVERRQKRMIKNRESAARSRARKQAYTQELENKVAFLEEENAKLRKQRDLDKALPPSTEPNKKLRRTSSAPAPL